MICLASSAAMIHREESKSGSEHILGGGHAPRLSVSHTCVYNSKKVSCPAKNLV